MTARKPRATKIVLSAEDVTFLRSGQFNPKAFVVGSAQRKAAELLERIRKAHDEAEASQAPVRKAPRGIA